MENNIRKIKSQFNLYKDEKLNLKINKYFNELNFDLIQNEKKEQIINLSMEIMYISFTAIRKLSWKLDDSEDNFIKELKVNIISELSDCCHNLPLYINLLRKGVTHIHLGSDLAQAVSTFCTIKKILSEFRLSFHFYLNDLIEKLPELEFIKD